MTKRDFQLIADVISSVRRETITPELPELERVAEAFADRLEADYPRFKRALFLEACWTQEERDAKRARILEALGMDDRRAA
jgi:hypothetical protein